MCLISKTLICLKHLLYIRLHELEQIIILCNLLLVWLQNTTIFFLPFLFFFFSGLAFLLSLFGSLLVRSYHILLELLHPTDFVHLFFSRLQLYQKIQMLDDLPFEFIATYTIAYECIGVQINLIKPNALMFKFV